MSSKTKEMYRLAEMAHFSEVLKEKAILQSLNPRICGRQIGAEVAFVNVLLDTIASSTPGLHFPANTWDTLTAAPCPELLPGEVLNGHGADFSSQ